MPLPRRDADEERRHDNHAQGMGGIGLEPDRAPRNSVRRADHHRVDSVAAGRRHAARDDDENEQIFEAREIGGVDVQDREESQRYRDFENIGHAEDRGRHRAIADDDVGERNGASAADDYRAVIAQIAAVAEQRDQDDGVRRPDRCGKIRAEQKIDGQQRNHENRDRQQHVSGEREIRRFPVGGCFGVDSPVAGRRHAELIRSGRRPAVHGRRENVGKPRSIRHVSVGRRGCTGQKPNKNKWANQAIPGADNLTKTAPSDSDYRRGGASPRRQRGLATAIRW